MSAKWKGPSVVLIVGLLIGGLGIGQLSSSGDMLGLVKVVPKELTSYRDIVKKVLPAVVSIRAVSKPVARTKQQTPQAEENDPFEDLFFRGLDEDMRRQLQEQFRRRRQSPEYFAPRAAFGSGVIIDPKGIVLTSSHVVDGADKVEVFLQDGKKLVSTAIFTDPKTDVAIVKLNGSQTLPYAELGDSDQMEIGDRVLAMGAPFELTGSVTSGIISGKSRNAGLGLMYEEFLQSDAAINPGNSGGPLVNLEGKIVGINTAIKTRTGGFQGVGLAVSSNVAKEVVAQLAKDGVVRRGYLGIEMVELTSEVAEKLGIKAEKGVVVERVMDGTPANKAGLKEGDVVVAFKGEPVDRAKLRKAIAASAIGKPVQLTVMRDGKEQYRNVVVEEQPRDFGGARNDFPRGTPRRDEDAVPLDKIGMEVKDLTPELAEQLGIKDKKGVVITEVEPGSVAQSERLQPGMVILNAERKPVESAKALKELLSKASLDKGVLLQVRDSEGRTRYVILKTEG